MEWKLVRDRTIYTTPAFHFEGNTVQGFVMWNDNLEMYEPFVIVAEDGVGAQPDLKLDENINGMFERTGFLDDPDDLTWNICQTVHGALNIAFFIARMKLKELQDNSNSGGGVLIVA